MAYLQFALICLVFGSNFILMDRATRWFGAVEIGFGRLASATAVLGVIWLLLERDGRLKWRDFPHLAFVAVAANAYPYVAQPALIGSGFGHSFFGMTVAFTPLLTILASVPLLGVRPTARQLLGVIGGLGFIALLMYDGNLRGITPTMLAVAISVPTGYALGNTWLRRNLQDTPPTPMGFAIMALSSLLLLPALMTPTLQQALHAAPPAERTGFAPAAAALATLGVLGTGACVWMFVRLVQREGPLFAGMVTYVVPVIAMLWGLFDHETITARQVFAIGGILAMVALVQTPARGKTPDPAPRPAEPSPLPADPEAG